MGFLGIGGNSPSQNYKWLQGALINVLNSENQTRDWTSNLYGSNLQNINPAAMQDIYQPQNYMWGSATQPGYIPSVTGDLQNLYQGLVGVGNSVPSAFQPGNFNYSTGGPTGTQAAGTGMANEAAGQNYIGQLIAGLDKNIVPTQKLAAQEFANGGWSGQYQQINDAATNAIKGGVPGQSWIAPVLQNLMQENGMTPDLQMTQNPLQGIFNTRGNTGASNLLLGGSAPIIAAQGRTPYSNAMTDVGTKLFSGQPIMGPEQAMSMARDQAGTAFKQQAQNQYAQALARGGGPGANVANGISNRALESVSDQGAAAQAQAVQGALNNTQNLQLQRAQQGVDLTNAGGQLNNSMLGIGNNMANNAGSLSNGLFLGGLGISPQVQNAATNLLNAGTGMGTLFSQNYMGGLGDLNSALANANQYALGMGNLTNQLGQTNANMFNMAGNQYNGAGGLYNNLFGQNLGAGQLGLQGITNQYNAWNNANQNVNQAGSNLLGGGNLYNNIQQTGFNPLMGIGTQLSGMYNTATGVLPSIFNGAVQGMTQQSNNGGFGGLLGGLLGFL